jgi:hypothetical protein
MAASKDIPPQTAFLYVPQHIIITEMTVRNSKIGDLILKHPEIFKDHYDAEYLLLIVFLWHEMLKGEESFWHRYFEIINISELPMIWSDEEIEEL